MNHASSLHHDHHSAAVRVNLGHSIADDALGAVVAHGYYQVGLGRQGRRSQAQDQGQHRQQGQETSFHRLHVLSSPPQGIFYLLYQLFSFSAILFLHSLERKKPGSAHRPAHCRADF